MVYDSANESAACGKVEKKKKHSEDEEKERRKQWLFSSLFIAPGDYFMKTFNSSDSFCLSDERS